MKSLIAILVFGLLLAVGVGAHADDQLPSFTQIECRSYVAHFYISGGHNAAVAYPRAQTVCANLDSPNPVGYDYFKYVLSKYSEGGHTADVAVIAGVKYSKDVQTAEQVTCLKTVVGDYLNGGHSVDIAFLGAQRNCQ